MALDDIGGEDGTDLDEIRTMTVDQLISIYGEESVARGLSYMQSLKRADLEYRESANPEDLDEGWKEGYDVDEVDTDAADKWAERMEDSGLGIDE